MAKSLILTIILIFLSSPVFATGDADFRSIQKMDEQLRSVNQPKEDCPNCALEGKGSSCFNFLDKMYRDDFSKAVTLSGGAAQCQSSTEVPGTSRRFSSTADLQTHFQKLYPELGNLNHNQIKSCTSNESDSIGRYKVSKFYYFMKKFNEGATRAVEEISAINNLIGDSNPISCVGKGAIPQSYNRCVELNQGCKAKSRGRGQESQLAQIAKESAQDEESYNALKKDIQTIDKSCLVEAKDYDLYAKSVSKENLSVTHCQQGVGTNDFTKSCREYRYEDKKKIEICRKIKDKFQTSISALEDKNPWFRSENYFKLRKSKSVADSIKEQMLLNRKELTKKIDEFQTAGLCLNGFMNDSKCDIKQVRKLLAATPELPKFSKNDQRDNAASQYLNVQACVEIKNDFNAETVKILKGAALDVTLILATGGATIGYKAAMLTKNVAGARKALGAVMAIDAIFASQSYVDVAKSCFGTAQKIELAMQSQGKECPGPKSNLSQSEKAHADCMMAAAMAGIDTATLGLPLISLGTKSLIDKKIGRAIFEELKSAGKATELSNLKSNISNFVGQDVLSLKHSKYKNGKEVNAVISPESEWGRGPNAASLYQVSIRIKNEDEARDFLTALVQEINSKRTSPLTLTKNGSQFSIGDQYTISVHKPQASQRLLPSQGELEMRLEINKSKEEVNAADELGTVLSEKFGLRKDSNYLDGNLNAYDLNSRVGANDLGAALFHGYKEKLDFVARRGIDLIAGYDYKTILPYLRTGKFEGHMPLPKEELDRTITAIDKSFDNGVVSQPITLYRAVDGDNFNKVWDTVAKDPNAKVPPLSDKAYSFTSLDKKFVDKWNNESKAPRVILEIQTPKGARVGYVDRRSEQDYAEVILPRNQELQVVRAYADENGIRRLVVRIKPDKAVNDLPNGKPASGGLKSELATSSTVKPAPRTVALGDHATFNHLKKDIPLIKNPEIFASEVAGRRSKWKVLHPNDPHNFPMPENKTAFDEIKKLALSKGDRNKQMRITELLEGINKIEKNGYPNKDSMGLAHDVSEYFSGGDFDLLNFDDQFSKSAHKVMVISTANISRSSMAEMNLFEIWPVGMTKNDVLAEGIEFSPERFFLHDISHAQRASEYSPSLYSLSTTKKLEILNQIDILPDKRKQELASWSLYHHLHEGSIANFNQPPGKIELGIGNFVDPTPANIIEKKKRMLREGHSIDTDGENAKPMTTEEAQWLLEWTRKNLFNLPEVQVLRKENIPN